jgi:hypothetical protein
MRGFDDDTAGWPYIIFTLSRIVFELYNKYCAQDPTEMNKTNMVLLTICC